MKKLIRPPQLPWLALGLSGLGMALRFWLFAGGIDSKGLLKSNHPAVPLVWILSIITVALLFILTRPLQGQGRYRSNFPASLSGAVGCCAAGIAIFITALGALLDKPDGLTIAANILGVLAAPCMVLVGLNRYSGKRVSFLFHTLLCLYFTAMLMSQYRHWSAAPQLQNYCFQLLSSVGLMLTAYHRATFDARFGKRRTYAFLSLCTLYFCCLSIPGGQNKFYYMAMALWLFTNLCSLKPMRQRAAQPAAEEPAPVEDPKPEDI